ncbi:serine hydrolase [Glycomyces halotolerans]
MSDLDSAALARIDGLLDEAVGRREVPGVVAGIARGDTVRVAAAGATAFDGAPMRRETLFRITSITKPITAVAVLSLVEDGLLDLHGPVDDLLPELADRRVLRDPAGPLDDTVPAHRPVTVRDLLTFTWGFGLQGAMFTAPEPWPVFTAERERDLHTFGPPQPDATPDPDTWIARLGELPLLAQPGERWLYNTGSQVLGVLASRAAGAPFDEVLRARVLAPLGMGDTGFGAADPARLATAYRKLDGELAVTDPPDGQWSHPPAFPDAAAGLVSSADDLLAFGRMLLRGGEPVLAAETVAEATRDQLTEEQRSNVWPGFDLLGGRGWGYGVSVLGGGAYTWEGGSGTVWMNVPDQDLTVVVLTQRAFDEAGPPAVCTEVTSAARTFG